MTADTALPVIFYVLMGLSMLVYVVLDGFDLGVGMLLPGAPSDTDRDLMVSAIGPFWDANETWLVLGVGILLIAFPKAHGVVLGALYLPVTLMLFGLVLRGVAFDFRVKARDEHKPLWNRLFFTGSLVASLAQGWMLGRYVTGFAPGAAAQGFAALIALALPAAYVLLGATWLVLRTEGALQTQAEQWARRAWTPVVVGMLAISLATPWVSSFVRDKWFAMPDFLALLPIPVATAIALGTIPVSLTHGIAKGRFAWVPFALTALVCLLGFFGLAFSLYPYVVMGRLDLWQAASATESLWVILIGCAVSVPAIAAYTVFAYRVFGGKVRALTYG
ncbi:MAG: cytochrome d ubiquinol oxidase subunit II [Candidatus Dactylopiibacterium sp.]|nr:cytochrome d ubiquinol oxidase subunit II [Candidatus Dactylopiibacterium sp.]